MRAAHFTAEEFAALNASLRASNDLAAIEQEAMARRDYRRLVDRILTA
jgi:hypothetical protein